VMILTRWSSASMAFWRRSWKLSDFSIRYSLV
jgi:hypothetical protein